MMRMITALLCATGLALGGLVAPVSSASARTGASAPVLPASVVAGTSVTATGTVVGGSRPVQLQRQFVKGWRKVAGTTSSRTGAVSFRINTAWYGAHSYRFHAPKTRTKKAWTSAARSITVLPSYTPVGSARSFDRETFARWNPCKAIPWRYSTGPLRNKAPISGEFATFNDIDARGLAVARSAVAELGRATGFTFRYSGTTTKVADVRNYLTLGWVQNVGGNLGEGGWRAVTRQGSEGEMYAGSVRMSASQLFSSMEAVAEYDQLPGNTPAHEAMPRVDAVWDYWRGVWLHELGHAVGLNHVEDLSQIMYPSDETPATRYQRGDLAGLRAMGANRGCIAKPYR